MFIFKEKKWKFNTNNRDSKKLMVLCNLNRQSAKCYHCSKLLSKDT